MINERDNGMGSTYGSGSNMNKLGSTGSTLGSSNVGMSDYGLNVGSGTTGTPFGSSSTEWSSTSDFSKTTQPHAGLHGMLSKVGLGNVDLSGLKSKMTNMNMAGMKHKLGNVDVKGSVDSVRNYAAANPGKVLGGLAAVAIGLGLLRGRRGY